MAEVPEKELEMTAFQQSLDSMQRTEHRRARVDRALQVLPRTTAGNWWCDARGDLHNDPAGSIKLAKFVDGASLSQRDANRTLLEAAKDLAEEVLELRALLAALHVEA